VRCCAAAAAAMPTKPTTYLGFVEDAIRHLKDAPGSSRQAIAKHIKANFGKDDSAALRRALKKGVTSGKLVQCGARFKIAGVEFAAAPVPAVEIKDMSVGEGAKAESGDTVTMKYRGKLDDGSVFDSGSGFVFTIDGGDVIKGWDHGIKGMRVGGKRKLKVPASLGYGKRGAAPEIPPNADLNFVVVLQAIA
jgi:hypothetical protein